MSNMASICVMIAHTNPVIEAGIYTLLAEVPGLVMVRQPAATLAQASFSKVDVLVGDYASISAFMQRLSGQSTYPAAAPRLMIVTAQEREWEVRQALDLGIHAYLLTDCQRHELIAAIHTIRHGSRYVCQSVSFRLMESLGRVALTRRELDVLGVMAQGACNKTIAARLGISVGTAKTHVAAILSKLHAASRTEAAAIAQARGLLMPPAARLNTLRQPDIAGQPAAMVEPFGLAA